MRDVTHDIVSSKDSKISKISKWFGELPAHRLDRTLEPSVAPRLFSRLTILTILTNFTIRTLLY